MPHASIIVPAHNAEATLDATLRSLRAQSFADLEIIVVDDGSTDRTVRIGADHAGEDRRVQLVVQANRGPAAARNSGIRVARGAIVGFCDAGDLWRPHKLAAHVRHLAAAPAVGLSFSGSARIGGAGYAPGLAQRPRLAGIRPEHVFLSNPVGNGSAAVLRRAALDAIAWRPAGERLCDCWFDESFRQFEDLECWLRLALTTDWQIEGVPGALTAHRLPPAGPPAASGRQLAAWERVVAKLTPLAPEFFARHTPAARAYQLRTLARGAVLAGDGRAALCLALASLRLSCQPLRLEPAKTLTTLAAALALRLFGTAVPPEPQGRIASQAQIVSTDRAVATSTEEAATRFAAPYMLAKM
ncbi:glycosyltransferase family 2 protein [Sinirhodobacter ferrireducens]|uniref:Glycosyltransferase family 2 protein n=1 Tax=Paenirhodobacter ferrireducens TaxID=1215032 RepID=A0A443LRV5_9RHOB|nr:glycosyltransferase family 2 protein [Sinirhodobacter ferrireducens]RWR51901.1 glycosyltransferase family 2 protein [Sinirhodobacter ferrireducens]